MLIEVINYDDKNVGTPSSKSWTLRSHGSHFFAIAGTETENFVELSGSNVFIKFITLLIVFILLYLSIFIV